MHEQSGTAAGPVVVSQSTVSIPSAFDIHEALNARRPAAFTTRPTREAWTNEQRVLASNAQPVHTEVALRSAVSVEVFCIIFY